MSKTILNKDGIKRPLLVNIAGPTAVGKTGLAIRLAEALGTEILSADSRQIYREMRIGTAVPSGEELKRVPHHFIHEKSIHETFTAADFEKEALARMEQLAKKYPVILMTGGTGLWFHALNYGLDAIPEVPLSVREELQKILEIKGLQALQQELADKDPVYYRQADIHNPRRVIRALEVIRYTGKPFSAFRSGKPKERPFDSLWFGLDLPREHLYRKIEQRVYQMMEQGLEDEARHLYPYRQLPALQTVGYKELFAYFDGKWDKDRAIREIIKNTRRYAKRQWTWFRKNPRIKWLDMNRPGDAYSVILQHINRHAGK